MKVLDTHGNRLLEYVRHNAGRASYMRWLAQLHEAIANDMEHLLDTYYAKEIADAIVVLDRLASLEMVASSSEDV